MQLDSNFIDWSIGILIPIAGGALGIVGFSIKWLLAEQKKSLTQLTKDLESFSGRVETKIDSVFSHLTLLSERLTKVEVVLTNQDKHVEEKINAMKAEVDYLKGEQRGLLNLKQSVDALEKRIAHFENYT